MKLRFPRGTILVIALGLVGIGIGLCDRDRRIDTREPVTGETIPFPDSGILVKRPPIAVFTPTPTVTVTPIPEDMCDETRNAIGETWTFTDTAGNHVTGQVLLGAEGMTYVEGERHSEGYRLTMYCSGAVSGSKER